MGVFSYGVRGLKSIIERYFSSFAYFYTHLRYRIFLFLALSIVVGVLDGFGLAMFLPLLQLVSGKSTAGADGMGNLGFLIKYLEQLGIPIGLGIILLIMILFFLLKGIITYLSEVYKVNIQQNFARNVSSRMLEGLNRLRFKSFVSYETGKIQNSLTGDVDKIIQGFGSYFLALQQAILVAVYTGFAFFVDMHFALLVTLGGGLSNILFRLIYRKTKEASRKLTEDSNRYHGEIMQHVGNFKYLKATGLVHDFGGRLRRTMYKLDASRRKIGYSFALVNAIREPILILIISTVIFVQVSLLSGNLGGILISLLFFYRALAAMNALQTAWNYFLSATGSFENISSFQRFLSTHSEKDSDSHGKEWRLSEKLEIRNGFFRFGETTILREINLTIGRNETVAFVGESGSGKTTLVNLFTGMMPLDGGEYLIDGQPVSEINLLSFQRHIGYITQDPVIFNDTVFNNVTLWAEKTGENLQRFAEAVAKSEIAAYIGSLPERENTLLGFAGINLSGGQRQRISIARELYKNVDILIMDEATSALDSETEKSIQQNIDRLKGQYTVLIVAHRLSTIRNVDRVIMMNRGEIEKRGTFQQLIADSPAFKRMAELQEI
jgi:ABC-type multidrug transport system fused ATPase/permease subunit